jgi:hypothetical protein
VISEDAVIMDSNPEYIGIKLKKRRRVMFVAGSGWEKENYTNQSFATFVKHISWRIEYTERNC